MNLHLRTADEVDNFLGGEAAVRRNTYFRELVLTPDILRERHERAVAPTPLLAIRACLCDGR